MNDTSMWHRAVTQISLVCALAAALVLPVAAETPASPNGLYGAFGGRAGIHAMTEDFVGRLLADVRIQAQFKDTKLSRLKEKLEEQICQAVGGPCTYTGDPMREVHQGMRVTTADFNALVEDLQAAMEAQGIPFTSQNALLALLAPMHREIVHPAP